MSTDLVRVGFGRTDITPDWPMPLSGYGTAEKRISTNVLHRLMATCIAFTDGKDETVLVFTLDALTSTPTLTKELRERINQKYGIAENHIMHAATHSHSTPEVTLTKREDVCRYRDFYMDRLVEAAGLALADRKPARFFTGTAHTERMNFVRHYIMNDGTYAGSNFGLWHSGIAGHTSEPDTQLRVVKICREGAQDILLMNWQAHPCMTGDLHATNMSSDYIGTLRTYMEEKTDCLFAYFLGAGGNLGSASLIKGEAITDDVELFGRLLGERAMEALRSMQPLAGGAVSVAEQTISCPADHEDDHLVPIAEKLLEYWKASYDKFAVRDMGMPYGINSPYNASAIITRSKNTGDVEMTLCAVKVGELSFACAPYEMFSVNGEEIKAGSPFDATFVLTCCNDRMGYLASEFAFNHGCYEKDTRRFPRGTAERAVGVLVELLKEMHGKS